MSSLKRLCRLVRSQSRAPRSLGSYTRPIPTPKLESHKRAQRGGGAIPFNIGPGEFLLLAALVIVVIFAIQQTNGVRNSPDALPVPGAPAPATIVRTYHGRQQADAVVAFQHDAAVAAEAGYFPVSQSWAPGQWGCGAFLLALVLSIFLIGILIFVYLLIVKPDGTLTVTYARRDVSPQLAPGSGATSTDNLPPSALASRLEELDAAHRSGLLTDEEYASKRAEVLERF